MGTAVGVPLRTRETVDCETPVASAMSRMVGAGVARRGATFDRLPDRGDLLCALPRHAAALRDW